MDFENLVESEKFLMVFGSPFKSMCKLVTLKSGVLILAILDVIVGVINFIGAIIFVVMMANNNTYPI